MFSIAIDIHRNILSAQCSIKCDIQNTEVHSIKVTCTKTHLSLDFFNGFELLNGVKIVTPANFFIPTSALVQNTLRKEIQLENDVLTISHLCHNPDLSIITEPQNPENNPDQKVKDDDCKLNCEKHVALTDDELSSSSAHTNNNVEINFRIQISSSELITRSQSISDAVSESQSVYHFFKSEIHSQESYQVFCTNCDNQLSTCPVTFHQVQEYCDNFSDLSESWFCHKKVTPKCDLQKNALHISETCIFLHSSISDTFSVDTCGKEVKCKTCSAVLSCGSVSNSDGEHLKPFYVDAVALRNPISKSCSSEEYYHKIVLLSLWTIISQKSYTCRLLFQSKIDETDQCLLMWIPPMKVATFKLQSTLLSMPTQVDFSTQDVYQVQYHVGLLSSPLVKKWSKDFNVDFYQVGPSFFNTLKMLLNSNTENNNLTDFSSGFLPCSAL